MKLKVITTFCVGMLLASCSSEEATEVMEDAGVVEVSTELMEQLNAEKELNDQAHQLNDELDQFMNDLEQ